MKIKYYISFLVITGFLLCGKQVFSQETKAQEGAASSKAAIELTFSVEDSVQQVKAKVTKKDADGKVVPAAGVEMNIYAKKSFGMLPLAEAQTTDGNGEIVVEFPKDLPGDASGNVVVVAKFEDNDELGTMETSQSVKWGIPVKTNDNFNKRALWASGSNAPLPLVITVTSMVAGVWAVIIYILVLLTRIKKSASYEIKN